MALFARPSSSAVKIVAPTAAPNEPSSPKPSKKDTTQRQCRNVLIYGSCKFQDKGCIYYHPPGPAANPDDGSPTLQPTPSQDSPTATALPAKAVNAPIFVPKASPIPPPPILPPGVGPSTSKSSTPPPQTPEPQPEPEPTPTQDEYTEQAYDDPNAPIDDMTTQFNAMDAEGMTYDQYGMNYDGTPMDVFYPTSQFVRQPLNYHLYTQSRPEALQNKYFISDEVCEELQQRSEATCTGPPPGLNLPDEIQGYHSLTPLEPIAGERRKFGNWYSDVYKAVNATDGMPYVLKRIENFHLTSQSAFANIEAWSHVKHPGVVSVKEAFTTRAFNDDSLIVVYDYFPNSQTALDAHLRPKPPQFQNGQLQARHGRLSERTIWSYVTQLTGAIRAIHDAGLAARVVDISKIIITGKNRARLSSCGLIDILMFEARQDLTMLQQEDFTMLGKFLMALCCNNPNPLNNVQKAIDNITRHYSNDLKNLVLYLIRPVPAKSTAQLLEFISYHLADELDESLGAVDRLEGELMSELENGRFVRIMAKMNFINERPEFARDPRWSETGDRYIIKLFRDYVFHQVDEHGHPVVNLSHVLTCLNKLDAGVDERIMLVSRDEQSCLVVSYREIKACIELAFGELSSARY